MKGFMEFVREQGVIGLAVGIILGTGVTQLVNSVVTDLVNPVLGIVLGAAGNLKEATWTIPGTAATLAWGNFIMTLINFIVVAAVIYFGVKGLKLDKMDRQKSA